MDDPGLLQNCRLPKGFPRSCTFLVTIRKFSATTIDRIFQEAAMPFSGVTLRTVVLISLLTTAELALSQAKQIRDTASKMRADDEIQILYTGSLMGYFRMPDWQSPVTERACDVGGP